MRPHAAIGVMAAFAVTSWAIVIYEVVSGRGTSAWGLGMALVFTVFLVVLPWFFVTRNEVATEFCRECRASFGHLVPGFCLACGAFTSHAAEKIYAKHI